MRIGELSERTGASARALRHYESVGLLRSVRLPNGYRDFGVDQVEKVHVIRELLAVGLNLDAVASIAPCYGTDGTVGTVPPRCALATERLRAELTRLDRLADDVASAQRRLRALIAAR